MKRTLFALVVAVCGAAALVAQQTVVTCPTGQIPQSTIAGASATVVCVTPAPPPPVNVAPTIGGFAATHSVTNPLTLGQAVTFSWSGITGTPAPTLTLTESTNKVVVTGTSSYTWTPTTTGDKLVTLTAANGVAPNAARSWTVRVVAPTTPPPPVEPIFGAPVTLAELGTCSAVVHDQYVARPDPPDGFRYRHWHPKQDPSGCFYGHEHGADLRTAPTGSGLPTRPFLFGWTARRMQSAAEPDGHLEAHGGFKQFRIVLGQANDEGRSSLMWQDSLFHMGTSNPRRMTIQHHTGEQRYYHPSEGLRADIRVMMDTGGAKSVCDPRNLPDGVTRPSKDGFTIPRVGAGDVPCQNPVLVQSGYEIWSALRRLYAMIAGVRTHVYTAFATPAVFDPITVFKRDEPTRIIFAWDDLFKPFRQFPNDDWTGFKGCDRESYAQPGIFEAAGLPSDASGLTTVYTTAMGEPTTASDPLGIPQTFTRTRNVDARGSTIQIGSSETKGNHAFKMRVSECGNATIKANLSRAAN